MSIFSGKSSFIADLACCIHRVDCTCFAVCDQHVRKAIAAKERAELHSKTAIEAARDLMTERDELKAKLAAVEKERDELSETLGHERKDHDDTYDQLGECGMKLDKANKKLAQAQLEIAEWRRQFKIAATNCYAVLPDGSAVPDMSQAAKDLLASETVAAPLLEALRKVDENLRACVKPEPAYLDRTRLCEVAANLLAPWLEVK